MLRETSRPAGPSKGVGFSDQLVVFGPSIPKARVFVHRGQVAEQRMMSEPYADHPSNPRSLSEQFQHTVVSEESLEGVPSIRIPNEDVVLRPPGKKRARFVAERHVAEMIPADAFEPSPVEACDSGLETPCTESDGSDGKRPLTGTSAFDLLRGGVMSEEDLRECTRINTRLNSMPSGGDFSFMNSSEDVHSETSASAEESESEDEDDDHSLTSTSSSEEELRLSRKMIRVDGSAKLSSASGLADEDFSGDDEDEFGIEGAERVDEEEAVQVRSFGRSFAKVSLRDGEDVIIRDPRKKDDRKGNVAFAEVTEEVEGREYSGQVADGDRNTDGSTRPNADITICRSTPPQRKSKMKITFARRSSNTSSKQDSAVVAMNVVALRDGDGLRDDVSESAYTESDYGPPSCFPSRRTTLLRQRARTITGERSSSGSRRRSFFSVIGDRGKHGRHGCGRSGEREVVAIPDMDAEVRAQREGGQGMVKNVSLQRDDWIEFATNQASQQKHPWLVRLVSSNGRPRSTGGMDDGGRNGGSGRREGRRRRRRFLRWWGGKE